MVAYRSPDLRPGEEVRSKRRGGYGPMTRNPPSLVGAADRIRTGDVQLGKLAFCH